MTSSLVVGMLVHAPKNLVGCILYVFDDASHIVVEILALDSFFFDLQVLDTCCSQPYILLMLIQVPFLSLVDILDCRICPSKRPYV
jgi:hypothetical protein